LRFLNTFDLHLKKDGSATFPEITLLNGDLIFLAIGDIVPDAGNVVN